MAPAQRSGQATRASLSASASVVAFGGRDRAGKHRRDELLENLVRDRVGVGGTLEGEAVQGSADCGGEDGCRKTEAEAEVRGHSLERVRQCVHNGLAALAELLSDLCVADTERPELIEEERPDRKSVV